MPRLPFVVAFVALVTTTTSTGAWEVQETRLSLGGGSPVLAWVPQGVHLIPGDSLGGADDDGRAGISASYSFGESSAGMQLSGIWNDPVTEDSVDLRLSLSHALTPNLYVVGTAAAATTVGEPRSTSDRSSVLFGASIGLRF